MKITEFISKMTTEDLLFVREIIFNNEEVIDTIKRFKKNYKGKSIDLDLVRYGYIIGRNRLIEEDDFKKTKQAQKPLVKREAEKKSNSRKGSRSDISKRSRKEE